MNVSELQNTGALNPAQFLGLEAGIQGTTLDISLNSILFVSRPVSWVGPCDFILGAQSCSRSYISLPFAGVGVEQRFFKPKLKMRLRIYDKIPGE